LKRDLIISSQLADINKVRLFLDEIFNETCLSRDYFNRVFLGISEAVNNSIVHGNGLDVDKHVFIQVIFEDGQLHVEIKDEGDGFAPDRITDPTADENLKKESGRGILIMHNIADKIEYFDGGSKVLIKYILG
jgi:serine/threonine-protein kinase RsbW